MLFKCLLTFIVILFYISEFLYQIQSSIVQQTTLQNDYNQLQPVFLFYSQHIVTQLRIWGKKNAGVEKITKSEPCTIVVGARLAQKSPQIEDYSSLESLNTETISRK